MKFRMFLIATVVFSCIYFSGNVANSDIRPYAGTQQTGEIVSLGPDNRIELRLDWELALTGADETNLNIIRKPTQTGSAKLDYVFGLAGLKDIKADALTHLTGNKVICAIASELGGYGENPNLLCKFHSETSGSTLRSTFGDLNTFLVGSQFADVDCDKLPKHFSTLGALYCEEGLRWSEHLVGTATDVSSEGSFDFINVELPNADRAWRGTGPFHLSMIEQLSEQAMLELSGQRIYCVAWGHRRDSTGLLCSLSENSPISGVMGFYLNWRLINTGQAKPNCELYMTFLPNCI